MCALQSDVVEPLSCAPRAAVPCVCLTPLTEQAVDGAGHDLVEDVVGALQRALRDDARLLQQVSLDVGAGQLAQRAEVDADELALRADRGR